MTRQAHPAVDHRKSGMKFLKVIVELRNSYKNRMNGYGFDPGLGSRRRWTRGGGWRVLIPIALSLAFARVEAALTSEQIAVLPVVAAAPVDFAGQIQPILENACVKCHGRGRGQGGFSVETRASLLKGGRSGPAVVAGKSAASLLIELVSGLNPEDVMPKKGSRLTPAQVGLLRAWIDQGLPWDDGVTFGRPAAANLKPRQPSLPEATNETGGLNPIDRLLEPYYTAHHIELAPVVADRIFLRRLYLDGIGLLPTPEELEAFLGDSRPDKRARWVDRVLAENQRYAEHWLTFWNDALRNDYQGTGYIDGGRRQISAWLFAALAQNTPYDRFVAQLVNPTPECDGFINGIVWRGVVNASQTPPMQAAQNIAHVFMGINLKCASCHDSFINDWTLADAYGMAGIYADGPLEMVRCDKPTGQKAVARFLYPDLGGIDPALDQRKRRERLAEILTAKQNGRLTRTIVNRFWAKFMGRGLVEPVDEMDKPAWNQDLLDWLAADLADQGYDLKKTLALMFTSRAYQLPAVAGSGDKNYVFRGPLVRRMDAEQYLDAVSYLTGIWHMLPANDRLNFAVAADPDENGRMLGLARNARWIGPNTRDPKPPAGASWFLRKTVKLETPPAEAAIVCAGDSGFDLFINGKSVTSGENSRHPAVVDVRTNLHSGENTIAVEVKIKGESGAEAKAERATSGFLLYARIRSAGNEPGLGTGKSADWVTDGSWLQSATKEANWEKPGFVPEGWTRAEDRGGLSAPPSDVAKAFLAAVSVAAQYNHTRAALVNNNLLMTALGRPNREQTVTSRSEAATTLQALELTNGATLARLLDEGVHGWLKDSSRPARELLERVYRRALGRPPSAGELALAAELTGEPVHPEGFGDFLWAVIMLPEFQLIY